MLIENYGRGETARNTAETNICVGHIFIRLCSISVLNLRQYIL